MVCIAGYLELAEDLALSPRDRGVRHAAQRDHPVVAHARGSRRLFSAATWSASTLAVTALVLVAVAVLVWRCDHREALVVALIVASGTALGAIAKRVTERPRPPAAAR